MLKEFNRGEVKVKEGLFRDRMEINRGYLLELDSEALLQNFYLEAGLILPGLQVVDNPAVSNIHWGWEAPVCQLRGHFLGHWMSAAARLVNVDGDRELGVKLDYIIDRLAECQERNGGRWIAPIPEKYFDMMIHGDYVWSPQYVMHKVLMGLIDSYLYATSEKALLIADSLADWYVDWTEYALKENPDAIYGGEQGGMLEIWAKLKRITGDSKYDILIDRYKDHGIFAKLDKRADALTDDHANASIPLSHGAAEMYELTGDEVWKDRVNEFWRQAVTERGMYATSGANSGEFWIPPMDEGQYLGNRNQEFCTVYNMVRTASSLYKWSRDAEIADYIERCIYNGFLAQQNKLTGMPAYFLPLEAGSKKKWGTKRQDFWCCHGTMVQAQTIYQDLIYYPGENDEGQKEIYVAQYIPSRLGTDGIIIEQNISMKNYNTQVLFDEHGGNEISRWSIDFRIASEDELTVKFRIPWWIKERPEVHFISGGDVDVTIEGRYIVISKKWNNDHLNIVFRDGVTAESLPGNEGSAALVDGPIVLAGVGDIDTIDGNVAEPASFLGRRVEHTYETFTWSQNIYMTYGQRKNFKLIPLYDITDEEYTVYFEIR